MTDIRINLPAIAGSWSACLLRTGANPFVDSLFVVLDSAGNAYLTGSGRTN